MRIAAMAIALLVLLVPAARAQGTHVSGSIAGDNWTVSGSPYYVDGDLEVTLLTIDPGVQVRFTGDYKMRVSYFMSAAGTPADSISFAKVDTITSWQGIVFDNCDPSSELAYCSVSDASNSGVRIIDSTISVAHCSFRQNEGVSGGGIMATGGAWFRISDCEIAYNTAHGGSGGGIYTNCASSEIVNCVVRGNLLTTGGGSYGGGIFADGESTIVNCDILENQIHSTASSWDNRAYGGGVFAGSDVTVLRCTIRDNSTYSYACCATSPYDWVNASSQGGGLYTSAGTKVLNTSITYNSSTASTSGGYHVTASSAGSGVYDGGGSIINCVVAYNTNVGVTSNPSTQVGNSIVFYNTGTEISGDGTVFYSDVQDGQVGVGNIDMAPGLISADDMRILSASPCVDAGHPGFEYCDTGLAGAWGGIRNDMGLSGGPFVRDEALPLIAVSDTPADQGGSLDVAWDNFPADASDVADQVV